MTALEVSNGQQYSEEGVRSINRSVSDCDELDSFEPSFILSHANTGGRAACGKMTFSSPSRPSLIVLNVKYRMIRYSENLYIFLTKHLKLSFIFRILVSPLGKFLKQAKDLSLLSSV